SEKPLRACPRSRSWTGPRAAAWRLRERFGAADEGARGSCRALQVCRALRDGGQWTDRLKQCAFGRQRVQDRPAAADRCGQKPRDLGRINEPDLRVLRGVAVYFLNEADDRQPRRLRQRDEWLDAFDLVIAVEVRRDDHQLVEPTLHPLAGELDKVGVD